MNAICKRLLSWLVVVTMVLSMVPVLDLSNFAVTTKAAENPAKDTLTAIENLRADFADKTGTVSAICPVCGGEEAVDWTPLTGATAQLANPNAHYYLSGDVTFTAAGTSFNANNNKLCLNLNGNDITAGGIALNISYGNIINVMDSAEIDGVVKGTAASNGATINVNNVNGKFNIYGGTFKKVDDVTGAVAGIGAQGGQITMYGGTIDASEASHGSWATTISMMGAANTKNAKFNLYGGDIKCGTLTALSGNYLGNISIGYTATYAGGAEFNMYGGTISGGRHTQDDGSGVAGNIAISNGNTLNVYGGTIYGGKTFHKTTGAATKGGNIGVRTGAATVNISGGTIVGDISLPSSATLKLSGAPQIVTSLEIDGETVSAQNGGIHVTGNSNLDISELTADANIAVTGGKGAAFTAAHENAANVVESFVSTNTALDVFVTDGNQLWFNDKLVEEPDEPEVGVFAPESCGGKAYCEACTAANGGEPVLIEEWIEIKGTGLAAISNPNAHYYLSGDATFTAAGTSFGSNGHTFCLHLNGKTMTAGGVAIQVTYGNTVNIMGNGTVKGTATSNGATINVNNPNAKVNLYGGTFKKVSGATGAVAGIGAQGGQINMYAGATIDASDASHGSWATTISMMGAADKANAIFNMHGGTIKCGELTQLAGNYLGNISIGYTNTYTNGAVFNMMGGTVIGGNHTAGAGGAFAVSQSNTLNISGGTIYGGTSTVSGGNIYGRGNNAGTVNISGGTIVGEIYTGNATTVKLSGNPQIVTSLEIDGETVTATRGFDVSAATLIDISELTTDANIAVTGSVGKVFTVAHANAANVVGKFTSTTAETKVAVESNQLKIVEDSNDPVPGVFAPWDCDGMAYCPVCGGDEPVEWTALSGATAQLVNPNGHYYLSGEVTFTGNGTSFNANGNTACLHLNGQKITAGGIALAITYGNTINVMGDGTVSGTAKDGGATINVNNKNGKVNIYGGTFKNVEGATGAVVGIGANGGTVNMRGGIIDAEGVTSSAWATAVSIMGDKNGVDYPGVFNMYSGVIKCGTTSTNRGNIMVGYDTARADGATFNMMGGTVIGGTNTANSYGTFLVQYGGTLNVTGGTIYGGTAEGAGANIFLSGNATYTATLNVSGGEICGDVYANQYATVNLSDAAKIVKELTVGEETVTAEGTGLYVYEGVLVNIDGLTAEAEVYVAGKLDTALTTGTGVTSGIKAYEASQYTEDVEGVVYLRQSKAAVVTAEGETFYPTLAEAIANVGNGYVALYADGLTITLAGDIYVDNRGYAVTVDGDGTLYAMDSANDDYNGYGSWTVESEGVTVATDVINPVNGNRYIVILNEEGGNTYSAHRVELYLTHASLRTSAAGLYYKAQYKCDDKLAERVMAYGIVFSATRGEVHQDNFDVVNDIYSIIEEGFTPDENHTVNGTSTEVFGIFKSEGRTNAENVAAGEAKVHATPYINVDCDDNGVSDNDPYVIGNLQNEVYNANKAGVTYAAMSLYDVLKAINDNWADYTKVQGQVQGFYNDWADYGMSEWAANLANISGANA